MSKYGEIKEKAWKVDLDRIDEGYLWHAEIVYSESRNTAKSKLLEAYSHDLNLNDCDKTEVNYLNIPVIRAKEYDKYEYGGEILSIDEIIEKKRRIERHSKLDAIMNDESITHCYIYKNGSYYADNHCGYVGSKTRAGIYTKEDAVSSGRSCDQLYIDPINTKEHNEMVQSEIEKLQKRLIK